MNSPSIGQAVFAILIGISVTFVVFLLLREVFCWYWKINRAVALLGEIRDLLAGKGASGVSPGAVKPQS